MPNTVRAHAAYAMNVYFQARTMFGYLRMNINSYSKFFVFVSESFVIMIRIVHIINHFVKIISVKNELKIRSFDQFIVENI